MSRAARAIAVNVAFTVAAGVAAALGLALARTPARADVRTSAGPAAAPPASLEAALAALHGADLVVITAGQAGRPPSALVALRARVPPDRIQAIVRDPARYRDAVPALARAEVVGRHPARGGGAEVEDLEWELEIPLFNLEGRAQVIARDGSAELTLIDGDLAPGRLVFSWGAAAASAASGAETILSV